MSTRPGLHSSTLCFVLRNHSCYTFAYNEIASWTRSAVALHRKGCQGFVLLHDHPYPQGFYEDNTHIITAFRKCLVVGTFEEQTFKFPPRDNPNLRCKPVHARAIPKSSSPVGFGSPVTKTPRSPQKTLRVSLSCCASVCQKKTQPFATGQPRGGNVFRVSKKIFDSPEYRR